MRIHARAGIRSRLLSTLLASVLLCSLVPASAGAVTGLPDIVVTTEWYVDAQAGDDANGGTSWDDAFATITAAVEAADSMDVIHLAEGGYTGEFPIMLDAGVEGLTFEGAGYGATILDAEHASRIFEVFTTSVTFQGMSFNGGEAFGVFDAGANVATGVDPSVGGAIGAVGSAVGIADCSFAQNYARAGGAVAVSDGSLEVIGCQFYENGDDVDYSAPAAQITDYFCEYGGALLVEYSEYLIEGCTFGDNTAGVAGGAVLLALSGGTIDGCDFEGNECGSLMFPSDVSAMDVGALQEGPIIGGIVSTISGETTVSASDFIDNYVMGAPVSGYAGVMNVEECSFIENESLVGGVLMIGDLGMIGSATIASDLGVAPAEIIELPMLGVYRCEIVRNTRSVGGIVSIDAATRVENTLVAENPGMLAGILTEYVPFGFIIDTTIAGNDAVFGVANMTATPNQASAAGMEPVFEIFNSIIWEGEEYSVVGAAVDASDLSTAVADMAPIVETAGAGDANISEDPQFVAPGMGDYRLKAGSPCIDTAFDLLGAPADDLDGLARPVDGDNDTIEEFDMGCYEFFGTTGDRVSGDNRYETAIAISQDHFASADTVVLATGRTFADGLAASGLAGVYHAPLLLTNATELSDGVADEIARLGATRVVITGLTEAITASVESELSDSGLEIDRIGGADRYETAALIAERIVDEDPDAGGLVFLARGDLFADALTASPVAYTNHAPVLLVRPDEMPPATVDIIETLGASDVVVVGGTSAVSDDVASQASALLASPTDRIDGADRYETSANFSLWAVDSGYATWNVVGVATGQDFPDALSGGAGIGTQNGTLMLTPRDSVHPAIDDVLDTWGGEIVRLQLFGGVNAVDDATKAELMSYLP